MADLAWKKDKLTGAVKAVQGKDTFTITVKPEPRYKMYEQAWLFHNGAVVTIFDYDDGEGKAALKRVAQRLADGKKPLWKRILKAIPESKEKLRFAYERAVKLLGLTGIPDRPTDQDEKFAALAAKGKPFRTSKLAPQDVLNAAWIRHLPAFIRYEMKNHKDQSQQWLDEELQQKRLEDAAALARKEAKEKFDLEVGSYVGPRPKSRDWRGLARMYGVVGNVKDGPTLADAKFKTIREWAEKTRDLYQEQKKQFLTVHALSGIIQRNEFKKSDERRAKAVARLKLVYADEWMMEQTESKSLVHLAMKKPEEPKKVEVVKKEEKVKSEKKLDEFGNRIGSDRAKANAVLSDKVTKSAKRIMKEAGVKGISNHLAQLVREGKLRQIDKYDPPRFKLPGKVEKVPEKEGKKPGKKKSQKKVTRK